MSTESVYNKRLAPETTMDQVEGLLEHFNLPPKTITFIRAHQRMLQVLIALVVVAVVALSLYGSHRDKVKEQSATALSLAVNADEATQQAALQGVIDQFGGTSAALWAKLELGHLKMKNNDYAGADAQYSAVLPDVDMSSPLFALVIFGKAQALEAQKSFAEAIAQYEQLKEFIGYEHIAYVGMGRIEEEQGNIDKAITTYNNFLLSIGDDPARSQTRGEMDAKISRLKALQ